MPNMFFQVRPRYCSGSPGMVNEGIARKVAKEEQDAYEYDLMGRSGALARERAAQQGLEGIAEQVTERKGGFDVLDLITGVLTRRETISAKNLKPGYTILPDPSRNIVRPVKVASVNRDSMQVRVREANGNPTFFRPTEKVKVQYMISQER